MKAQEIRELIEFIAETGLEEVNIETEAFNISVKRSQESTVVANAPVAAPAAIPAAAPQAPAAPSAAPAPVEAKDESSNEANLVQIKSPMIGTFYRSPSPEADSFVSVGSEVKAGQKVCIIEAMKLFNEIESEVSGKIVKVLVDNSSPVEYDQPLFLVDPS